MRQAAELISQARYPIIMAGNGVVRSHASTALVQVVCVYSYTELDDAIARANSLPFAFQASVCTCDIDTALYVSSRLNASAVMVNDHTAFRVDWMPFAGLKQSGYEGGRDSPHLPGYAGGKDGGDPLTQPVRFQDS